MRRSRGLLAALLVLGALPLACVGTDPVPANRYYRLQASADQPLATPLLPGVLEVERFMGAGLMNERAVLYTRRSDEGHILQHHYHYWIEPPTQLLQQELVDYARRRRLAETVVTRQSRVRADFAVSGRVERFERVLGEGAAAVRVELRLALTDLKESRLLWASTYTEEAEAGGDEVADAVDAFDRSVGAIFARFVEDVRAR